MKRNFDMKKRIFPPMIYVTREEESDGSQYYIVHLSPQDAGEINVEKIVALYKFESVHKLNFIIPQWTKI